MYRILLTNSSFIIASAVVIAVFITATTYTHLAVAILLYPLLVFLAYKVFQNKIRIPSSEKTEPQIHPLVKVMEKEKVEAVKTERVGIADIDKRMFLKIIGGAGILVFLYSIFSKKSENLFFKNIPGFASGSGRFSIEGITGKKIDPAQNQPMDGYKISEIDSNIISYYGFINKDEAWYIMRVDTEKGSFRYSRGESNFSANWSNRENLKYGYFSNLF